MVLKVLYVPSAASNCCCVDRLGLDYGLGLGKFSSQKQSLVHQVQLHFQVFFAVSQHSVAQTFTQWFRCSGWSNDMITEQLANRKQNNKCDMLFFTNALQPLNGVLWKCSHFCKCLKLASFGAMKYMCATGDYQHQFKEMISCHPLKDVYFSRGLPAPCSRAG